MTAAHHPRAPAEGPRALLLQRDCDRLERVRDMLIDALRDSVEQLAALRGQDDPTVRAGRRAITLASLSA
jgi:hypothetical protein